MVRIQHLDDWRQPVVPMPTWPGRRSWRRLILRARPARLCAIWRRWWRGRRPSLGVRPARLRTPGALSRRRRWWSQQFRDRQFIRPARLQRPQRLGRIRDLIRLDDPVMVCIQRMDHRWQRGRGWWPVPVLSGASAWPVVRPAAGSLSKCRASRSTERQRQHSRSFNVIALFHNVAFRRTIALLLSMILAPQC